MTTELYDPNKTYAPATNAHLTYRGGPLLKSAKLFGVFVDAGAGYPGTASNNVTGAQLSAFLNWIAGSDVVGELAEYNVGLGSYIGSTKINLTSTTPRSEEHTSELQSPDHILCRLLLEKKKIKQ